MEVTLEQILDAREARAERQFRLNCKYRTPILSFTMNIPGPVKDTPLIRRAFQIGLMELDRLLPESAILSRQTVTAVTGCEAAFAVNLDAAVLKSITTRIEDSHPLGRLFDLDVLDTRLEKLDRDIVGGGDRGCIVCGAPGRNCASRRLHSVPELQKSVQRILTGYFSRNPDFHTVGTWAALSLLDEVSVTPKPGLVDRANSGSHRDMDLSTFVSSTAALVSYFRQAVQTGWDTRRLPHAEAFSHLRKAGSEAETAMFSATGGINTHKGAIFTLGLLCGAAGRLWDVSRDPHTLLEEAGALCREAMEQDFHAMTDSTAGGRLYRAFGIRGIRGEAMDGFPSIRNIGLPVFGDSLSRSTDWNQAGTTTLLHLIAQVEDTNMISRGGVETACSAREKARSLLPDPTLTRIGELDRWFTERNLSPGGCADLFAAVCFLHRFLTH